MFFGHQRGRSRRAGTLLETQPPGIANTCDRVPAFSGGGIFFFASPSASVLQDATGEGSLVVTDIVYTELCIHFETQRECDTFLESSEIRVLNVGAGSARRETYDAPAGGGEQDSPVGEQRVLIFQERSRQRGF